VEVVRHGEVTFVTVQRWTLVLNCRHFILGRPDAGEYFGARLEHGGRLRDKELSFVDFAATSRYCRIYSAGTTWLVLKTIETFVNFVCKILVAVSLIAILSSEGGGQERALGLVELVESLNLRPGWHDDRDHLLLQVVELYLALALQSLRLLGQHDPLFDLGSGLELKEAFLEHDLARTLLLHLKPAVHLDRRGHINRVVSLQQRGRCLILIITTL
jgi:hypothetical protein